MTEAVWVALVGLAGLVIGHFIKGLADARASRLDARAQSTAADNSLIDQLQEELGRYRSAADTRATAQDDRMNHQEKRLEAALSERDGYRSHAHTLHAHIVDGKPPPPPTWPIHLPK